LATANGVGEVFVETLAEDGFVVEQVEVGRTAGLKEADDAFRLGCKVGESRQAAGAAGGKLRVES
jgi:hypothetical protein